MNPSYYGAKSSSEEDIENFYLDVIRETMAQLKEEGCVLIDETEGTDSLVAPTPLGRACSNFYLLHQTPLQMKKGANELKKVLSQHICEEKKGGGISVDSFAGKDMVKRVKGIRSFFADTLIHTYAVAKILYELSFTHGQSTIVLSQLDLGYTNNTITLPRYLEYDELPVRHNEEELNLELSKKLPWGYDLSKVSFWIAKKKYTGNLLDIMLDPHTKCFLLLQVS